MSVDLTVSETLIAINTLAVKRAALRGGLWSTAGKSVEKPLMQTLCTLYGVSTDNYQTSIVSQEPVESFAREVDFYLVKDGTRFKCEVKLMGKGNPESADVVIARGSKVFVADKLSDKNKKQLDSLNVEWVALRDRNGFQKFETVLRNLNIPFKKKKLNSVEDHINTILDDLFLSKN